MEYENNASLEAKVVKDFDKVQFVHKVASTTVASVSHGSSSYHLKECHELQCA